MPSTKQRREAARRHLERQSQRREEREAARRRFTLIASIVGSIILIVLVTLFVVVLTREGKKTPSATAAPLPPDYTIFGKVDGGLDVATKVAAKGSTPAGDGKPKLPIMITSVSIAQ